MATYRHDPQLHANFFGCQVCHTIVSLAVEAMKSGKDAAIDELSVFCNALLFLRSPCKGIVHNSLTAIMVALEEHVEPGTICSNILSLCELQHRLPALNSADINQLGKFPDLSNGSILYMPKASRLAILNLPTDGDVLPMRDILSIDLNIVGLTQLFANLNEGLKWMARYRLIANRRECKSRAPGGQPCGAAMSLIADSSEIDKAIWHCSACRAGQPEQIVKVSVREGSLFSKSKLSLLQILQLMYTWSTRPTLTIAQIKHETGITASTTIVEWYNMFRDIAQMWCEENLPIRQLGGPGHIVEIDESMFFRAKYNRGHAVARAHDWVFGMLEQGTNNVQMVIVERRNAATLLPLIQQYILPGTRIISDGWAAYGGIAQLQQQYDHDWVNHRVNFVDPNDPTVHTQGIEATCGGP